MGSHVGFGADRDPKAVPGVRDPGDTGVTCPWRREPPTNGVPLLCRASSAATGIQTAHKAELLEVFIAFPPDFFLNHFHFACVFDSFYLLSHH